MLQKASHLINQDAKREAQLAVFPEVFLSGYPNWLWSVPNNRKPLLDDLYADLHAGGATVPGKATEVLCEAAKKVAGTYKVQLNARHLASGVYLYRLKFKDQVLTRKMIVLK